MKILIFTNYDMGLYKFRKELIEELQKKHEVHLGLPNGEYIPLLQKIGCVYHNIKLSRRGTSICQDMALLIQYLKLLKRERPDVVFTYTIKPNIYGGIACRLKGIPYLANVTGLGTAIENGGTFSKILIRLYGIGLRKAQCVFFQNKDNMSFLRAHCVFRGNEVLLPGSGVNLKQHCYEPYPKDTGKLTFLFVGRLMKDKGVGEFVGAAHRLAEKYDNLCFAAVGECETEYEKDLEAQEADKYVTLYGKQDDVHAYMKNAHAVILPSYHEGMANVLLEAAACGRPVLASKIPGCMETFDEGVSGFGFKPHSVDALVQVIERFIALEYHEKADMGMAGRKKVEREFDRQQIIDAYKIQLENIKER